MGKMGRQQQDYSDDIIIQNSHKALPSLEGLVESKAE